MTVNRVRVIEIWHDIPQPLLPLPVPNSGIIILLGLKKRLATFPNPKEPPKGGRREATWCYQVQCKSCHKPTWSGCGLHIEAALRGVPEADRCPNWSSRGPFRGKCAKKGAGDALGYDAGGRRVG